MGLIGLIRAYYGAYWGYEVDLLSQLIIQVRSTDGLLLYSWPIRILRAHCKVYSCIVGP